MATQAPAAAPEFSSAARRMPPIAGAAIATLALIVIGGVYMAANLPRHPSLALPVALAACAGVLLLGNCVALLRIEGFAWARFRQVAGWALLAYVVIAGMLAYVFIYDHTRGAPLALLCVMLTIFALDVPLLLGFSVARYESGP